MYVYRKCQNTTLTAALGDTSLPILSYHVAVSPQTINQRCRSIGSRTLPPYINRP